MLVSQTNPVGVELFSYANAFFCYNRFAYLLSTWVKTLYTLVLKVIAKCLIGYLIYFPLITASLS